MNNEQLNSDKKVLASLEAEYKRAQRVIYSIRALVTDLNFEELIPDSQERCLMVDELQAYDYIRTNLMNRIRFYRNRVKANKPEPWEKDEAVRTVETLCGPVRVINTDKVPKEELDKMMFQTQHDPNFDDVDPEQKAQAMASHHCGQDAEKQRHNYRAMVEGQGIHIHDGNVPLDQCGCIKMCKVGGGSATVQDPNESQPADAVPESLLELVGMQVQLVFLAGHKCDGCDNYTRCNSNWKKVELVGGYYLCLAPIPIVTE